MAVINTARAKVSTDDLGETIRQTLAEYGDAAIDVVKDAARKTKRNGPKVVNQASADVIHGRRGKYEKSWKAELKESHISAEVIIYSSQPGLPHLLESGHAITYLGGNPNAGSGESPAIPHLAKAEEEVIDMFEKYITEGVEKL